MTACARNGALFFAPQEALENFLALANGDCQRLAGDFFHVVKAARSTIAEK
jgi:hypothetical protein